MSNIFHIQKGSHGGGTLVKDGGSAGGGCFKILLNDNDGQLVADKTSEEIIDALEAGLIPVLEHFDRGNGWMVYAIFNGMDVNNGTMSFTSVFATGMNGYGVYYVLINGEDGDSWLEGSYPLWSSK